MTKYMTIDEILNAVRNDVTRHIENDTMKKEFEDVIN